VLATVMVGTLLVGLDRTVINLAVPSVIGDFDISVPTAGWLATAYLISDSVFIPVFGKLGDMVGDRRVYAWGMWGFLITSVLCGLAWNYWVLVFFRVLQGLVGAAVFPTALSLITRSFRDPGQRTQAFGIWSASFAASIALGPLVGGPLIDNFSWRWIFYINFPISLAGLWMAQRYVAADLKPARLRAFDWQGAVLLGLALAALILVLERGREWGWTSPGAMAAYATMVGAGAWFMAYERRVDDPVIDLKLFRNWALSSSLAVSLVSFAAMVGTLFLLPVFAQQMLGYDATESGLVLLPMAATLMIVAPVGTKLTAGMPMRIPVVLGLAISAVGIFLLADLDVMTGALDLIIPLVVLATGLALGFAPLTAVATNAVPGSDVGMASGILNLTRNIGAAVGIALFATILDNLVEGNVFELARGTVVEQAAPAVMTALPQLIAAKAQIDAYSTVFGIASIVMLIAGFVALALREPEGEGATSPEAAGAH
jgi:EmrB/QacA subfamily drug resistance transporter